MEDAAPPPPDTFTFTFTVWMFSLVSQRLQKKLLLRNIAAVRGQNRRKNIELGSRGNWNIANSTLL